MSNQERNFIIASSVTARFPEPGRFGLRETIDLAKGRAKGVQLYIDPARQPPLTPDDIEDLKTQLKESYLNRNVVHLPGYLIPSDLEGNTREAMRLASALLDPIPDAGKVAVIHHLPYSGYSEEEIVTTAQRTWTAIGDPDLTFGFENYYPPAITNQENLPEQVQQYLSLLQRMQAVVSTIAVFDTGKLHTINANNNGKPLDDPEFHLMQAMCEAVKGQPVLLHIADIRDINKRFSEPGNSIAVGSEEGVMTPVYNELARLGRKNGITWIGAVDETEDINAISNGEVVTSIFASGE